VRVPAYHNTKASRRRIQIQRFDIVQHVNLHGPGFGNRSDGQRGGPFRRVHIAAHGYNRRKFPQSIEDFRVPDVSGMDNQFRATERAQRLCAQ
jgi:hypothetical protein